MRTARTAKKLDDDEFPGTCAMQLAVESSNSSNSASRQWADFMSYGVRAGK